MATRGDAAQGARVVISAVINSIAEGTLEVGAATPIVAPLCVALLEAKKVVDGASRNGEELEELCEQCDLITVQVIDKAKTSNTSTIDVKPLQECVEKLKEVAKRYHDRRSFAKFAQFRRDGDDIERLRARIEAVVPIMGLAGVVNIGEKVDQILARLQPRLKLAPKPVGVPEGQSWHALREGVMDRVYDILSGDGGPALAALTGRSGAGKTTAAAAMVGDRHGPVRPRRGETEEQARARLDRLRARFSDGVVYLWVGKGAGAADRIPNLMLQLAKAVHMEVMKGLVDAPGSGEAGERYVKRIVEQESRRCLVVADDVCEPIVVQKLRETGMWVLLTTRTASMVEPNERVVVDRLEETEAENVLRGGANLPPGYRLCDDAMELLEICGYTAMDIAFVGSWSAVRTVDNCAPKSSKAWAGAVKDITAQMDDVPLNDLEVNRLAVLRTGFKYLAREDPLAQELYAMLAVFPDGYSFHESDAAVLLDDEEAVAGPVSILERWSVLTTDASGKYRMHDAHADFARGKLIHWEDVRQPSVDRWTSHISLLDFALAIDTYPLLSMWHALERVGGKGWFDSRPYDDQLVRMDASNPSKVGGIVVVASLYGHDRKFHQLDELTEKVLEQCDDHMGGCYPGVRAAALFFTRYSLGWQGRHSEAADVDRRLREMTSPELELQMLNDGGDNLQASVMSNMNGLLLKNAGRHDDAAEWFRKAIKAQEVGGLTASLQAVWARLECGRCEEEAGRSGEAERQFRRALKIQEDQRQVDHPVFACTLVELGRCVREAGRRGEAEALFRRALEIFEAKLGSDDEGVAWTLLELGRCEKEARRRGEAEALFRRALEISEAKVGPDAVGVAYTLLELGRCEKEAGRRGEAEALFRRALEIFEAKLGSDDVTVAWTLLELGRCEKEAGRRGEEEALFRRALEIFEAKLGSDDEGVAWTLLELGRCEKEARRRGEAEALFRRALEIFEAKFGPDDVDVAWTLLELRRCEKEAGRRGEAEALFRRALEIFEAKLGSDDEGVAWTLLELGRWEKEARRRGEAEALFRRALEIFEAKFGPGDLQVFVTRYELERCVEAGGRPAATE